MRPIGQTLVHHIQKGHFGVKLETDLNSMNIKGGKTILRFSSQGVKPANGLRLLVRMLNE